jgi:hypothetical protein
VNRSEHVILLGLLTVLAVLPLLVVVWRDGPLVLRLLPIACGAFVGRLFTSALDESPPAWQYAVGALLALVPWVALGRWRSFARSGQRTAQ